MKIYSIKQTLIIGLAFIFVSCLDTSTSKKSSRVAALPFYKEATFTPHWLDVDSEEADIFHRIPNFDLVNQLGQEVTEATFKDKIYIADFFFTTCPGICPKMTANMMVLQEEFLQDNDILLLSHSVTPETDSIPVLKRYAEKKRNHR